MSKTKKRIMSFILAVVMLLGCGSAAFAAYGCNCGTSPLIVVSGMAAWPLVQDEGTSEEKQVFPPDTDTILKLVGEIAGPLALFAITKDYNQLGDSLLPAVKELLEPLACKADGTSKYNITTDIYPESMASYPEFASNPEFTANEPAVVREAVEKIGADHVYYFNYDWRLDPMDHARELRKYVEKAKEETGHDKVNLAGASMGGTIIASYLYMYGSDDIDNFTMLSSAFTGTTIVGNLFNGRLELNKDGLIRILKEVVGVEAVNCLFDALDKAGVFDVLVNFADSLFANLKDRMYDEVFKDTFFTMPGIWDLIALEDYEDAKAYLLDPETDAQLIDRIDSYHYNVQAKLPELLEEAMENGVKVNVVSHYNMQGVPITPSYNEQNDNVIDTKYTSGYAVCAYLDETLPADYKQQNTVCKDVTHNHISADRIIDASTCLLPEQTWFLKNQKHVGYMYHTELMDFILMLCLGKVQYTVENAEPYGQFMEVNPKTGELTVIGAVGGEEPSEPETTTEVVETTETGPTETEVTEPTETEPVETDTQEDTTKVSDTETTETEPSETVTASDKTQTEPTEEATEPVKDTTEITADEQTEETSNENSQQTQTITVGDSFVAIVPFGAACAALVLTAKRKRNKI